MQIGLMIGCYGIGEAAFAREDFAVFYGFLKSEKEDYKDQKGKAYIAKEIVSNGELAK